MIIFDEQLMKTYNAYIKGIGCAEVNLMAHGFIRIKLATDTKNVVTAVESIIKNIKEKVGE